MARNYAEKIAKGSSIVLVMSLAAAIIGYVLRIFLSRNLTVEEFGLFYAVLVFISSWSILKDFGLGTALVKYVSDFLVKNQLSKIKSAILYVALTHYATGFIVFVFLVFSSDYIVANYFKNILAGPVFIILLVEFLLTSSFFVNTFQGFQKMKFFSLVEFIRISLVFVFVMFFISLGPLGVAYSYLGSTVILQIVFFYFLLRVFPTFLKEKFVFDSKLYKGLWKFGLSVFIGSFAGIIVSYASTILLTLFATITDVGFFQVALPTSQLLWVFPTSLGAILFPTVSVIWARGERRILSDGIERLIKFSFILMLPLAMILFSFPEIIIRMLFGEAYLPAAPVLQILSIGAIFYAMSSICFHVILGIGKPMVYSKILYIMAFFSVALNVLLIPMLGVVGAGITTSISYFIGFIFGVYYVRKNIKIRVPWSDLFKTFIGGLITLLIVFVLKEFLVLEPIIEVILSLAIAFSFYISFIITTRLIRKGDIEVLKMKSYLPKVLITLIYKLFRD